MQAISEEKTSVQTNNASEPQDEYSWMGGAAATVAAFCEAIPELDEELVSLLMSSNPSVVKMDPKAARQKLQDISSALAVDLPSAARLVGKVPEAWTRDLDSLVSKIRPFAVELLGSSGPEDMSLIVNLISSQPALWSINTPFVLKDRLEGLSEKLRINVRSVILLVGKQPIFWMIKPGQVKSSLSSIREKLGLSEAGAIELVVKMPVVVSLEPSFLVLGINGLSSTMGVPIPDLIDLVAKNLGLIAVPAEVLGSNLETLASLFEVEVNKVVDLVIRQPTLLATQAANIANAIDLVSSSLGVNRSQALDLIIRQPGLLYDIDQAGITTRIEALSKTFLVDVEEMRGLVIDQPDLLVITPNTIRAALSTFMGGEEAGSGSRSEVLASCLSLLVQDPGTFVLLGYMGEVIDQWVSRLGLDQETLSKLVARHPALLEMSPSTVKARLEGLGALFSIPLEISASLLMKHPALAVIPPNATITKAKGMSLAFGCSMQTAATLMAKEPGVLSCCASPPGELNRDLKPYVQAIQEVSSYYEFYTMEWISQTVRDNTPKNSSFQEIQKGN